MHAYHRAITRRVVHDPAIRQSFRRVIPVLNGLLHKGETILHRLGAPSATGIRIPSLKPSRRRLPQSHGAALTMDAHPGRGRRPAPENGKGAWK